jgi:hypothetical protein
MSEIRVTSSKLEEEGTHSNLKSISWKKSSFNSSRSIPLSLQLPPISASTFLHYDHFQYSRGDIHVFCFIIRFLFLFLTVGERWVTEVNSKDHKWTKCQFLNYK